MKKNRQLNERYFIIFYIVNGVNYVITLVSTKYPNKKIISNSIIKKSGLKLDNIDIRFSNIVEIKKNDYDEWLK